MSISNGLTHDSYILGIDPGTNVMGYGVIHVHGNKADLVAMGVIDLRRIEDPYLKLGRIFERVTGNICQTKWQLKLLFLEKTFSPCSSWDVHRGSP